MSLFASLVVHQRALDVRVARHQALASNVANVDTPAYKARGLDFDKAMEALATSDGDPTALAPRPLDDAEVDLDRTLADLAANGVRYGATSRLASKKLALLRYAASDGQGA